MFRPYHVQCIAKSSLKCSNYVLHLCPLVWSHRNFATAVSSDKTKMIRLLGGERISTIYLTVVTRYRIAMDKQTDGETFATAYTNACIAVKTTPCPRKNCNTIRCHDTGKQCRILTKFYNNTETLKVKQVAKFQQNRSTSATATASLVRSLKSISVHYRHRRN